MTVVPAGMTALRMVQTPRSTRRWAAALFALFLLAPFLLLATPYQQSVSGAGEVIAYAQEERPTPVNAPVEGRIGRWHVKEGQFVKKGAPLVDIQDNDPDFLTRLREQKSSVMERKRATRGRADSIAEQIIRLEASRDQAVRAAGDRLAAAKQDVAAAENAGRRAEASLKVAAENFRLQEGLFKDSLGLTSRIEFVRAEQDLEDRKAAVEQAKAGVAKANDLVRALAADVDRISNSENAVIQAARANLEAANDSLAAVERDLLDIDVRLSRQGQQEVRSPATGIVWQVSPKSTVGQLVKAGDLLVEVVPDTAEPVVELFIDGNDLPLLMGREGQHVRLQFEGYPAVQFVGWPSVAVGTFGGRVKVIDPSDDGKGHFRILVEPDPNPIFEDDNWPGLEDMRNTGERNVLLRQGMRVNGWVFLNRVSLGWELWRRVNGFPPVVAPAEPGKDPKPEKLIRKKPK